MKILLLGGLGYIGGALVKTLWEKHQVTILDRLDFEVDSSFFSQVINKTFFHRGNICHIETVYPLVQNSDVVVNLCSLSLKDSATNPTEATMTNQIMGKMIGDICHSLKKKYIYLSTCSNYGISEKLADEYSELLPVSIYAITKVNTEKYLLKNVPEATILRCATAFGVSPSRTRDDVLLNEFVKSAINNKKIELFQPTSYRPLCHVDDISLAIQIVCEQDVSDFPVYNIGKENMTKLEIARMVAEKTGSEIVETKSEDPRNYRVNFDKARDVLGFHPTHTIASGIEELIRHGV